jgi:host factor-I protein
VEPNEAGGNTSDSRRSEATGNPESNTVGADKPCIQDEYLNEVRKADTPVRVLLNSGKDLRGLIRAFDTFTFVLETHGVKILVYKSAVAAIGPNAERR